jgi:hypothetical protein
MICMNNKRSILFQSLVHNARKPHIYSLFLLLFLLSLFSCGISGPAGKYLSHVNKVYSIIVNNPVDATAAADGVYEYVMKNQEAIEKASAEMKKLSAGDTEKIYFPVIDGVNRLITYINTYSKDDYPLLKQEKLVSALQILLQ